MWCLIRCFSDLNSCLGYWFGLHWFCWLPLVVVLVVLLVRLLGCDVRGFDCVLLFVCCLDWLFAGVMMLAFILFGYLVCEICFVVCL